MRRGLMKNSSQSLSKISRAFVPWKNLCWRKSWTPKKLRPKQTNLKQKQKYAKKAMQSFGQTKERMACDEAHEEPKKKKRKGGNDSTELLREKSEQELEVRKQELQVKEKGTRTFI